MPDDARERVRRAQHPRHRRQAHPVDPQRDEHRRRVRDQRSCHRRARRAVQQRRPAVPTSPTASRSAPTSSTRSATSASRARATCSPRSRPPSCSTSAPTTRSSPWPPTAARCIRASGPRRWPPASAASSTPSTPARFRRAPRRRHHRAHDRVHRGRSAADLQPRLLHMGRAAGHTVRPVRTAPRPGVLAWAAPVRRRVGRDDHRLQRPRRVQRAERLVLQRRRLPVRGVRGDRRRRHTDAVALPERRRRRSAPRRCRSCGGWRRCAATDDPNPFVDYDADLAWVGVRRSARHDRRRQDRARPRARRRGRRGRRHRVPRHAVRPIRRAVRRAGVHGRRRRVGQGRDRQRRREPQGTSPVHRRCLHLRAAELLGLAPWSARVGRPAGDRLVRQRRACRGDARPRRRRGRSTCSSPTGPTPAVVARLTELGRRTPRASDAPTTRLATRRCCASVRRSTPGRCRSRCRGRRTRCASTAGGRSGGRWPSPRHRPAGAGPDRVFVQVGGGAFAACVGAAFRSAGVHPIVHAVQTEGCAPLALAWERARRRATIRSVAGPRS